MWLYDAQMHSLGFRRRGERYWQCERRLGLSGGDHVSVFCWSEQRLPTGGRLVELTEFHVTFYRAGEQLHFYYHQLDDDRWRHEGNTSHNEIRRLGLEPAELRAEADAIARELALALGGTLEAN
jgi:hypothetical protein